MLLLSCDEEHVNRFVAHLEWVGAKFTHRVISLEDDLCPFKYWCQTRSNMMRINCANHSESSKLCNMTIQTFISSIFSKRWWTISCWKISCIFIYLSIYLTTHMTITQKKNISNVRLFIKTRCLPNTWFYFWPQFLPIHTNLFAKGLFSA